MESQGPASSSASPWGIRQIATNLREACAGAGLPCELVVNVDNPHEAGDWAEVAHASRGFVVPVFSANIHEARGYNRAARAARGKYLIIWQDDQLAPPAAASSPPSAWLRHLMALFRSRPQLGLVGMNTYRLCRDREPTNRFGATPWQPDPQTGVSWSFVQFVDFAPLVIRTSVFWSLGGLEEGFTRRGDCGIWGDWELSNRAWLSGWQLLSPEVVSSTCPIGGVTRYGQMSYQLELCEKVRQLNLESFRLSEAVDCPYGTEETSYGNCSWPGAGL
ncbi:hypothetical protein VOLCADRAFT_106909, partial [Volvox carteri f. nagariensis]